jgi:hypothetical protein
MQSPPHRNTTTTQRTLPGGSDANFPVGTMRCLSRRIMVQTCHRTHPGGVSSTSLVRVLQQTRPRALEGGNNARGRALSIVARSVPFSARYELKGRSVCGKVHEILGKNAGSESQPLATNPRSVRSNVGRSAPVSGPDRPFRALVWALGAGVCYAELRRITLPRTLVNKDKF